MKTSCTVLIPHVDTEYYLNFCVEQVRKYKHPDIEQKIIVIDQSSHEITLLKDKSEDLRIIKVPRIDAGYPIDVGLKEADTEYFCTLDCDAFPIHKNWLFFPISAIERYGFSFVGNNTGLDQSYKQKGNFFHINNYFRISKTSVAKEISEAVGFMRVGNRPRVNFVPKNREWGGVSV